MRRNSSFRFCTSSCVIMSTVFLSRLASTWSLPMSQDSIFLESTRCNSPRVMGAKVTTFRSLPSWRQAIEKGLAAKGPYVLQIEIEAESACAPWQSGSKDTILHDREEADRLPTAGVSTAIHVENLASYLACPRQVENGVDNVFYLRDFSPSATS